MAQYKIGDKVKTTDVWDNGMGTLIPKGSIVEIEYDNGEICCCSIQGKEAWYEYKWLGDVVENEIINSKNKTNADKIRSMNDKQLAIFLKPLIGTLTEEEIFKWLQTEAQEGNEIE